MNSLKKVFTIALIVFLIGTAGSAYLFMKGGTPFHPESVEQSKQFEANDIRNLNIEAHNIDVRLVQGNTDQITARLHGEVSKHLLGAFQLRAEENNGTVNLKLTDQIPVSFGFNYSDVRLDVTLPAKKLEQISLSIAIGDINLEQINANQLKLNSNGDITLRGYQGNELVIASTIGDLKLSDIEAKVDIKTTVGGVKLSLPQVTDDILVDSTVGDVEVKIGQLPESLQVDLQTTVGDTSANIEGIAFKQNRDHKIRGTIGTDGPLIHIRTTTGDIQVTQ